jgi:hypothetical protein
MDVSTCFLGWGCLFMAFLFGTGFVWAVRFLYMWRRHKWTSLPVFWGGDVCLWRLIRHEMFGLCLSFFYTC